MRVMQSPTVIEIVNTVGPERIKEKVGVSHHAVRKAREVGKFAGNWYGPIRELCDEVGIICPLDVFNWKTPSEKSGPKVPACSPEQVGCENSTGQARQSRTSATKAESR